MSKSITDFFIQKDVLGQNIYESLKGDVILEINDVLINGNVSPVFLDVIINDELVFNNSGFTMRIKPTTLTANRSLTLPDVGGNIVIDGAIQTLTNKTLTDPNISGDIIFNTGGFTSRIGVPVLTSNKTLIIPDAGGQIITESASQNLTNKRYRANDGTASEPTFSFQNGNSTGFYRSGMDTIGITTGGTLRATIGTTSISPNIPVRCQNGTESAPVFSFSNSSNTGLFYESKGVILSASVAGSKRLGIDGTTTEHSNIVRFPIGSASAPTISFSGLSPADNSGMFLRTSGINGILAFSTNGTERGYFTTTGLCVIDGTATNPSLSFTNEPDCGLFVDGINILGLSIGGTKRLTFTTTNITSTVNFELPNGSSGSPAYGFSGSINTGMYRDSSVGDVRITITGNDRLRITSAEVNVPANTRLKSIETWNNQAGTANVSIDSAGLFSRITSSIRFKKNIEPFKEGLNIIDKLNPITYQNKYKTILNEKEHKYEQIDNHDPLRLPGVIAEELDKNGLGLFVEYGREGQCDSVLYDRLPMILINCVKELRDEIENLKNKIG
jgi:hypothetical protein